MKYLLSFLGFLVAIGLFVFFMLFTQSGNNTLKPYLEKYSSKKLQQEVHIEAFTLKTNFLDIEAIVNKNSKIILNGNFDIIKQTFAIDYDIDAKNIKTPYVNIKEPLHVKGRAQGTVRQFEVKGAGLAFRSQVKFATNIENKNLKALQVNAKNIKIEDLLAFVKKPIYSRGLIDVDANIKTATTNNYTGQGHVTIHYGTLNNFLLEKDFGIKLPTILTYRGSIKAHADNDTLYAVTQIVSNVAQLNTKNTQYNLKDKVFYSDYTLHLPKLSLLEKRLQGDITLDGNIKKDKDDLSVDVNSNSLGGIFKAVLFNDTLKVDVKDMHLDKVTNLLKQPKYSDGKLTATLDMTNIKPLNEKGNLDLSITEGNLHVQELLKTKQTEDVKYTLHTTDSINKELHSINADFDSDILKLKLKESQYNANTQLLQGIYSLHVEDLNNLYMFTQRAMKGVLQVDGKYSYANGAVLVDGNTGFLDANTTFNLEKNVLHVRSDDLSIVKVTDMLYYPQVFDSFSTLEADYNLTNKVGVVSVNALNGKLMKSELTDIVQAVSGFDLSSEIYKDSLFRGAIDDKKVDFSLLMNGLESYFKIPAGYVNLDSNEIKSDFDVKIKNKDFQGSINGSLDKPEVKLNSSEYIKQKLNKAIDKNLPDEWKDTAKGLLNLFN